MASVKSIAALALLSAVVAAGAAASVQVLRDPTRPLPAQQLPAQAAAAPLQLHAILIGAGRRAAVIDGRYLRERDVHGGVQVMRILPGRVIVRHGSVEKTLLLGAAIKKPRADQRP